MTKTYIVHLQAVSYAEVEVEAESEDEAEKAAMQMVGQKGHAIRWDIGEAEVDDTECLTPEVE